MNYYHVIETPCYPASWKVDCIKHPGSDNATYLYKRAREEAQKLCDQMNEQARENAKRFQQNVDSIYSITRSIISN